MGDDEPDPAGKLAGADVTPLQNELETQHRIARAGQNAGETHIRVARAGT